MLSAYTTEWSFNNDRHQWHGFQNCQYAPNPRLKICTLVALDRNPIADLAHLLDSPTKLRGVSTRNLVLGGGHRLLTTTHIAKVKASKCTLLVEHLLHYESTNWIEIHPTISATTPNATICCIGQQFRGGLHASF